jgi:WD40 repeat protein
VHGAYHADPLVVSSDGNHVAVLVGGKGTNIRSQYSVQVWDIKKGVTVGTYVGGELYQAHSCFTFVPNSTDMYIAVQRSLDVWSPKTGKRRTIASADCKEGYGVQHMRVLNDGSLVTSRADGRVCLWDTKKGVLKAARKVRSSIYRVAAGGGSIRTNYIVTSPDAKQAVALDYFKTPVLVGDTLHEYPIAGYKLTLWDVEKGKSIRDLPLGAGKRDASSVAWSNDGRFIAWVSYDVADGDGRTLECVVWDVSKEKEVMREKSPARIWIGGVISFSPDGKLLGMPAGDNSKKAMVAIWDISDLTKAEESRAESKQEKAAH